MIHTARSINEANLLAQAIVNTIREPLLVLDADLRVLAASRYFYETFRVEPAQTEGSLLYALGEGQWDIPALRLLLETIIVDRTDMDGFEVEHDFPKIGHRIMLLNARRVLYEAAHDSTILLAFEDVTASRLIEQEREAALLRAEQMVREKQVLLDEMQHRVANSLQIIASILMLKARAVSSKETRHHLEDAHQRVMSVAAVQKHLHASHGIDQIEVGAYLATLCAGLSASMVGESQPVEIRALSDTAMIPSAKAVSLGLIVTELVMNALKYAFPQTRPDALILVQYETADTDWALVVSDNGAGKAIASVEDPRATKGGLGTAIVEALAKQLEARMDVSSNPPGLTVSITHATFTSRKAGMQ